MNKEKIIIRTEATRLWAELWSKCTLNVAMPTWLSGNFRHKDAVDWLILALESARAEKDKIRPPRYHPREKATHELKPCPFCGSKALMIEPRQDEGWCVVCQEGECACNARIPYCGSESEAVQQWNRRVTLKDGAA